MADRSTGKAFGLSNGDIKLTHHFNLSEFTRSEAAQRHQIDNTPNVEQVSNLRNLCFHLLEPIREFIGEPVYISSGYRSKRVNYLVGGVDGSQHTKGQAADIYIQKGDLRSIYDHVVEHLNFDQMILYPTFIHISFVKHNNRREAIIK